MRKKTLRLRKDHQWKCRDGYQLLVADRGAVSFGFPHGWKMEITPESVRLHDREPPDDDCRLEMSFNRLPPGNWDHLPLSELLEQALAGSTDEPHERDPFHEVRRFDLGLVWTEQRWVDVGTGRPACSRIALGVGGNVHVLLTFVFWADDAERLRPVWDVVLDSLQLGRSIKDPRKGAAVRPRTN